MFSIDLMSRTPVYEQIIEQLETFVLSGILKAGDQIPSVRSLSVQLAINPNTIQKAYSELDRIGIIYTVPGKGSFIAADALDILRKLRRNGLTELKSITEKLALAGIREEEVLECIQEVYAKNEERSHIKNNDMKKE